MLEVKGVTKAFGGFLALNRVSLLVKEGNFHALVGPNGAGKTTLFNVIVGRYRPDEGEVQLKGQKIHHLPTPRIVRMGVGVSFQRAQAFLSMTARENLMLALLGLKGGVYQTRTLKQFEQEAERAEELLGWVGLERVADRVAAELPLGDLKRLDITMSLAGDPELLLLDEPLAGLSRAERRQMVDFIAHLLRQLNLTLLFTEHDTDAVLRLADRITVLHQGEVLAEGEPEAIKKDPRVIEAFLGGSHA